MIIESHIHEYLLFFFNRKSNLIMNNKINDK